MVNIEVVRRASKVVVCKPRTLQNKGFLRTRVDKGFPFRPQNTFFSERRILVCSRPSKRNPTTEHRKTDV
jgi:hypothetical protein